MSTGGLQKSLFSESIGFIGTCVSLKKSLGHMWQLKHTCPKDFSKR